MAKVGVIGAGTWGIALARMLSLNGHAVTVWSAIENEIQQLNRDRRQVNLPQAVIPADIRFTTDLQEACRAEMLLFVVPSVYVRATAKKAAPFVKEGQIIIDAAKGLEPDTLMTMTEVIASEIPGVPVAALSGPTHAEEVAMDLPTTIVAAHGDIAVAEKVQKLVNNPVMRAYTNSDVKGVELCGALKNIIALATGISAGLGYGDNTKAAIITRGLEEIKRLGLKMGCRPETFAGLAGLGDLVVTATSQHSRNNRCGFLLGQGYTPSEAIRRVGMVVEGINAIPAAMALSRKYDVEMPITAAIDEVVNHGLNPREAVARLMARDTKPEHGKPVA